MDIARLAPIFGALLFAVPLLWPRPKAPDGLGASASVEVVSTSSALVFVFVIWAGLIVFSALFTLAVRRWAIHWTQSGQPRRRIEASSDAVSEGGSEIGPEAGKPAQEDTP